MIEIDGSLRQQQKKGQKMTMDIKHIMRLSAELSDMLSNCEFDDALKLLVRYPEFVPDWDEVTRYMFSMIEDENEIPEFLEAFPNVFTVEEVFEKMMLGPVVNWSNNFSVTNGGSGLNVLCLKKMLGSFPDTQVKWNQINTKELFVRPQIRYLIDLNEAFPQLLSIDGIFDKLREKTNTAFFGWINLTNFVIDAGLNERVREIAPEILVANEFYRENNDKSFIFGKLCEAFPEELNSEFVVELTSGVSL